MRIKTTLLRSIIGVKEAFNWTFWRLPASFTIPLIVFTFVYFVVLYPVLVYQFVPWLLVLPARGLHAVITFTSWSQRNDVRADIAAAYHHILNIFAALLTLLVAGGGVIVGHALAAYCYQTWRTFRRNAKRSITLPVISVRKSAPTAIVGGPNPLDRFKRIGIILAGGGAKGAYQAGAMKAIYEFLEEHGAHHKVTMIAGTSIGSWNALFWLADMVKDGVDDQGRRIYGPLEHWWRRVCVPEIIKPVGYWPTRQNFFLSNDPWQENFEQLFGSGTEAGQRLLEHMQNPDVPDNMNFYFTCTNTEQAKLEVMTTNNKRVRQRDPNLGGTDKLKNLTARRAQSLEDLRFGVFSSMDLPPLFQYATGANGNGQSFYEDGGIIDNLPIYFGTEVEECDLLFVLPLNASFEEEVNHRSVIRRLARVTNIRQGVLERKAFRDIYLFNEIAYLREYAKDQEHTLKRIMKYLVENKKDMLPGTEQFAAEIQNIIVPETDKNTKAGDITPLQRALRRKHKPVHVFSICPAPKLKINTAQFWKTREAGEAFELMYDATKRELELKFEWVLKQNYVTMWKISDTGDAEAFTDF